MGVKVVAFSLALVAFSSLLLSGSHGSGNVVRAEGIDYKTMQSAMLSYFHDDTENADIVDKMSPEEYRIWGIFLSNLYTPFRTAISSKEFGDYSISDDGSVKTAKDNDDATVLNRIKTQFKKSVGENSVANKLSSAVQSTIVADGNVTKLKTYDTEQTSTVAELLDFIDGKTNRGYSGHYFYSGDIKNPTFAFSTHRDRLSGQTATILSVTAGVSEPMKSWQYVADVLSKLNGASTEYYKNNDVDRAKKELKGYSLYVSAFGDILAGRDGSKKYLVLIPACLNPYTFDKSGRTLHLNNALGMANFVVGSVIKDWGKDKDKWELKGDYDPYSVNFIGDKWDVHNREWGNLRPFLFTPSKKWYYSGGEVPHRYLSTAITDEDKKVQKDNEGKWSIYQPNWSVYATRVFSDNREAMNSCIVNTGISVTTIDSKYNDFVGKAVDVGYKEAYTPYKDFVKSISDDNNYYIKYSYVNIATSIFNGGTDAKDAANQWVIMQIPLSNVSTSIALFKTSVDKTSSSFNSSSYTAVEVKDLLKSEDLVEHLFSSNTTNIATDGGNKYILASEALTTVNSKLAESLSNNNRAENGGGAYIAGGVNLWAGIYWAYMSEAYGLTIDADGTLHYDESKASGAFSHLPEITTTEFKGSLGQLIDDVGSEADGSADDSEVKRKQDEIIGWLYTILSPETHINSYVTNWLKSMVDNLVLSAHNAMIGADLTNLATTDSGTNVYHSVVGYITTPSVSQMPVVNWIYDNYMFVYIVLMVLIAVILIVYVMIRMRRIGQAVTIFIVMGFVLLLPHSILNTGILVSNSFAESIFSNRFSYWAIVQHEESIVEEADASTESESTQTLVSNLQSIKNSQYGSGVTLKWLSPKKERFFGKTQMSNVVDESGSGNTITMLGFYWLFNDQFQGESYNNLEESGNVYLYRSYYSIYTSAKEGRPDPVTGKNAKNKKDPSGSCISNYAEVTDRDDVSNNISNVWKLQGVSDKLLNPEGKGFTTVSITGGEVKKESGGKKTIPRGYRDPYISNETRVSISKNEYTNFNRITDALSNNAVNKAIFTLDHTKDSDFKFDNKSTGKLHGLNVPKGSSTTPIGTGEKTFLLYTESPYYYFYNVFSTAKVGSAVGKTDFVSLLLSEQFFKVTDTNSVAFDKTKDFLDLEGLFTYVIPYLNRANANVEKYMEVNGTSVKREDYAKEDVYNHSLDDMESMWNLYTSWVDAMYDIYGDSQTAKSGYNKVSIKDPLNPASYYIKSRPMSYSPADARLKGYVDSDLTTVEKKMQNVLEKTRTDLLYLLNYKDFEVSSKADKSIRSKYGSEVLISAAAMIATFNFNQEFSDTGFGGSGIVMYPQSYELKNMNYDSYLRLILQNATGKTPSLSTEGKSESIYSDIITETSVFTGIFLLFNDVLAVYAVPALKIIVIIMFTALGLLLSLFCMISPPEKILNVVLRNYIVPVLGFTALLCVHTWAVSLFVGEGATGVLGSQTLVLTTEDPTVTLLLLIACDLIFCYALFKLLKWSLALAYKYSKNILHSVKAIGGTALGLAVAGVAGSYKARAKVIGAAGGAVARKVSTSVSRHKDSKSQARAQTKADERAENRRLKRQVKATQTDRDRQAERLASSKKNKPKKINLAPMSENQKQTNKQRYGTSKRVFRNVKSTDSEKLRKYREKRANSSKGNKNSSKDKK